MRNVARFIAAKLSSSASGDAAARIDASIVPTTEELQVISIAKTAPVLAVSGGVLCAGTVACFWGTVPTAILLVWAAAAVVSMLLAPFVLRNAQQERLTRVEAIRLHRWILWVSVARALVWGVGAAVFAEYADAEQLALLCVLVLGNAMGSGAALMAIARAATAYCLCTVTPLAAVLIASGTTAHVLIGVLFLVYAFGMRSAASQVFVFVQEESALRRAVLQAKAETERLSRAKSDFLAHMSHELRTPLNAIIGFSETMAGEMFGPIGTRRYVEYAQDINDSGQHLLRLINNVLDLSKVEAGALEVNESEFDPKLAFAAVERLVRDRAQQSFLKMKWSLDPGLPRLRTDERLLQQILINLVTNAIKFTGKGGSIAVTAAVTAEGGFAFSVADTGIGMHAEDIETALKPFGQVAESMVARGEGTGLGLPLCQRFAQALGGSLAIASVYGRGTTVTVTLPPASVLPRTEAVQAA